MRFRFFLLISGTTLVFLLVLFNIYTLQFSKGEYYTSRAQAQSISSGVFAAERGIIYFTDKDKNKIPAAINKDYSVIFAVPTEVEDVLETGQRISELLELDFEEVSSLLSKPKDQYEELITKATKEQVQKVKQAKIKGLHIGESRLRYYPFGAAAAHTLGFVGLSDRQKLPAGQYGLENMYNGILSGKPGEFLKNRDIRDAIPGKDVVLTIDHNIQSRAEEVLSELVEKYEPISGLIIVQDPKTGKILALANNPTFDPNNYQEYELDRFVNPAISQVYEPGSIFKIFTMSAGIDSGAITPDTTYYDTGSVTLDGRTIQNWDLKSHGELTMTEVIEGSVNTGTVFAEQQMGHKTFYEYLLKFGFKDLTDVDLLGETAGRLTPLEKYPRDINFATASYGQGVSVTPIRLITAVSAIANKGMWNQPYLTENIDTLESHRVIDENTAKQVIEMMVSAVKKAYLADVPRYNVAGKTGTAYKPDFVNGGYTDNVINTYSGFAPAYNPAFTILIKIDSPKGSPLAGQTVVPAFKELAEFILNYYNIPPDE